jgi:hypothetical protein
MEVYGVMVYRWKLPPQIKVLEALGSIGDERLTIHGNEASLVSSEGDKTYRIVFDLTENAIDSDDNGSKFKGYLGYPSIAVFMLKGKLSFEPRFANALKGIAWKKLNDKYRSYAKVEAKAKEVALKHGVNEDELDEFVKKVMREIKRLAPVKLEKQRVVTLDTFM